MKGSMVVNLLNTTVFRLGYGTTIEESSDNG